MSTARSEQTSDLVHRDTHDGLKKVSQLVASMVDPVTAALEEIQAARHTRRLAMLALTFAIVCSFCVQGFILFQNYERTVELKKIGERQQAHFVRSQQQIEALLSFAQSQTRNEQIKRELQSAQQKAELEKEAAK